MEAVADHTKFFDAHGWYIGPDLAEYAADCAHSGDCQADVENTRQALGFAVPRERAIAWLGEFGAWDDLETWNADRLADTVLWIACGNIADGEEFYGLVS